MPLDRIHATLAAELNALEASGSNKGAEDTITSIKPPHGNFGPRYMLAENGSKAFLRMNSNSYLGMSLHPEVIEAEEHAARKFGAGPGAVRFISGTFQTHIDLEAKLAAFHGRESAMIFSSAYATVMGVLAPLITKETLVVSDALNHNCIINAIRLSRPAGKGIFTHLDMEELDQLLTKAASNPNIKRVIVVTDGIFSMRGDYAPLDTIASIVARHDPAFSDNAILVVDDSHGVGAFGKTGRGTEEITEGQADLLIGTLGKAFGVNGGYVASSRRITDYLREKAPLYIYSNPITPAEAAAALKAIELVDSDAGRSLLKHLSAMTARFEHGLLALGYETIPGPHPVVPLMIRDTPRTAALQKYLFEAGILVTGLNFPVVPKGDESLRFQISADHTAADIDYALSVLENFPDRH